MTIDFAGVNSEKVRGQPAESKFVLSAKGDMKGEEMAKVFLRAMPKIQKISRQNNTAFVARITREGKVAIIKKKKR